MNRNAHEKSGYRIQTKVLLTVLLALLAVCGNYLAIPLFYGVDLVFGSIAVMLAIRLLGLIPAVIVAVAGGLYTILLWGHPYALLIFTLEAVVVSLVYQRLRTRKLVLADCVFWLFIGMPLVLVFYRATLGMTWESALLIAVKQPINGIFNALVAVLLLLALRLYQRKPVPLYGQQLALNSVVFNILLGVMLLAGIAPIIHEGYIQRALLEETLRQRLQEQVKHLASRISATRSTDPVLLGNTLATNISLQGISAGLMSQANEVLVSQGELRSIDPAGGKITSLGDGLGIWLPDAKIPTMQRWRQGRYVMQTNISGIHGVSGLLVEHAAEPLVQQLESRRLDLFGMLAILLFAGIGIANIISNWLTAPISRFARTSHDMNEEIASGRQPVYEGSYIKEYNDLSNSLNLMSENLATSFGQLKNIQSGLENEVMLRSKETDVQVQHTRAIIDNILDGIITIDRNGIIKTFSQSAGLIFGYKEDEVLGKNVSMLMPEPHSKQHDDYLRAYRQTGQANIIGIGRTVEGKRKDGSLFPLELSVSEVESSGGEPIYIGMTRDVTERTNAQNKIDEQRKLLNMLNDTTTSFVDEGDIKTAVKGMLDDLLELTGCEYGFAGEVLYTDDGKPYLKTHDITNIAWNDETQQLYEKQKDQGLEFYSLDTLYGHVLASGQVVISNDPANDERARGLPQGHPAINNFLGVPVFYGDELVGMYGIANRDKGFDEALLSLLRPFGTTYGIMIHSWRVMAKEQQNRLALVASKEEAEKANRAKSEFLSSMSHELRTPLNAILGFGQLLENDDAIPAEQKENITLILNAGNHLLSLINEILDLSRVESGHVDLSLGNVQVSDVIDECLPLVTSMADRRKIIIELDVPESVYVTADRIRFKQALLNILSNAIKYNRDNGKVGIKLGEYDNRVTISVTDTGPGISHDKLDELFEPFNRLGAGKTGVEGTGIGLALTRKLIDLMGGMIDVSTAIDQGSTFTITLPGVSRLPDTPVEQVEAVFADTDPHASLSDHANHKILYIEDNPANLKLVGQILSRLDNMNLLSAHTAELGIELAREHVPDLILLDINLPGMDGYAVMKVFKADPDLCKVPVIAITANAMSGEIEKGRRAGFIDYLTKPLNVKNFIAVVNRCLGD